MTVDTKGRMTTSSPGYGIFDDMIYHMLKNNVRIKYGRYLVFLHYPCALSVDGLNPLREEYRIRRKFWGPNIFDYVQIKDQEDLNYIKLVHGDKIMETIDLGGL